MTTTWDTFREIAASVGWPEWDPNRDGPQALAARVRRMADALRDVERSASEAMEL